MGFMSFFQATVETRELHSDSELRTRYYRNNFDQCLEAVKKLAAKEGLEVRDVNKTHGEIYMLGNGFDAIITVCQVNPIEAGIDFKINFFSYFGLGRPKKKAVAFFKFLDSELKFKGVALHP
jgi:hypothetical protein